MEIKHRHELPDLMRHFNLPMIACILGVAEGYDSADLLRNGVEKLFMIDIWSHSKEFPGDAQMPEEWHQSNYREALKKTDPWAGKRIILIGKTSERVHNVPDKSCGLIYIDSCHEFRYVLEDSQAYWPKLVDGGIMAFHDYLAIQYGVHDAVHHFAEGKYQIHLIPENAQQDAGAWIQKPF